MAEFLELALDSGVRIGLIPPALLFNAVLQMGRSESMIVSFQRVCDHKVVDALHQF